VADATFEEVFPVQDFAPDEIRPLRRAEYDKLVALGAFDGEKIELLHGALVAMSPTGTPHASAMQMLTVLLVRALSDRAAIRVQLPFAAGDDSEPEPDFAVVPPGDYLDDHPREAWLVVEVAESSLRHDRGVKRRLYAECGVPEYWFVNLSERVFEVHSSPAGGDYTAVTRYAEGEAIRPSQFPDVELRVDDVIK
jgi:Uma2 family endonuclease